MNESRWIRGRVLVMKMAMMAVATSASNSGVLTGRMRSTRFTDVLNPLLEEADVPKS
jgi:hypothetical protein